MNVHSVRIAPTKLILVGTRIPYQATGDAGLEDNIIRYIPGTYLWEVYCSGISLLEINIKICNSGVIVLKLV